MCRSSNSEVVASDFQIYNNCAMHFLRILKCLIIFVYERHKMKSEHKSSTVEEVFVFIWENTFFLDLRENS